MLLPLEPRILDARDEANASYPRGIDVLLIDARRPGRSAAHHPHREALGMGYTAVKGGAEAIEAAEKLIQTLPTEPDESALELRQLRHQLGAAVDKVIGEGGVYAPDLAAQAIRQTEGDLFEAAFVLRAYRSTLPRLGYAQPVRGDQMRLRRRISSAFRDIPGGQLLGRTRDYTQRLLELLPGGPKSANGHVRNGHTVRRSDRAQSRRRPARDASDGAARRVA